MVCHMFGIQATSMDNIALPVVSLIEERDFPKEKVVHGDGKNNKPLLEEFVCLIKV